MMNKLLFMPLLLVLLPIAYAEESIVEVPFDFHGQSCTFDEIAIEYHCVWQGTPDKMTPEDLEDFKDVLTDKEYAEILDDLIEEGEANIVEEPKKTPEEIKVERLLKQTDLSEGDAATLRALANLADACEIGIEEGARIQDYGKFILPDRDITVDNVNLKNYPDLRDILMKIEECTYWNEYRAKYLVQYLDMVLDDETIIDHHSNHATSGYVYNEYFVAPLDPKSEETKSKVAICTHSLYGEQFKKQMGCHIGKNYEHDPSLKPHMKDYVKENSVFKSYLKFQNGETSEQLNKNIIKSREAKPNNYGGSQ